MIRNMVRVNEKCIVTLWRLQIFSILYLDPISPLPSKEPCSLQNWLELLNLSFLYPNRVRSVTYRIPFMLTSFLPLLLLWSNYAIDPPWTEVRKDRSETRKVVLISLSFMTSDELGHEHSPRFFMNLNLNFLVSLFQTPKRNKLWNSQNKDCIYMTNVS